MQRTSSANLGSSRIAVNSVRSRWPLPSASARPKTASASRRRGQSPFTAASHSRSFAATSCRGLTGLSPSVASRAYSRAASTCCLFPSGDCLIHCIKFEDFVGMSAMMSRRGADTATLDVCVCATMCWIDPTASLFTAAEAVGRPCGVGGASRAAERSFRVGRDETDVPPCFVDVSPDGNEER